MDFIFNKLQEQAREQLRKSFKNKVTHVFMQDKHLKCIPKLKSSHTVSHAYFHNNEIEKIENLTACLNMTFLNLQNNAISKIENINHLTLLKKLFLGNNKISVVERLNGLRNLEELYLEKQSLEGNDQLIFDPRSTIDIGITLKILDVSSNGITTLDWIKPLRNLNTLVARNNRLDDFEEVADNICVLFRLTTVYFAGNPMMKKHRCIETLIARCLNLRFIDDKSISEQSRQFLSGMERAKKERKMSNVVSSANIEDLNEQFGDFDIAYGPHSVTALTVKPPENSCKKTLATNASYSLVPRCFVRNKYWRRPAPKPDVARKVSILPRNSLDIGEKTDGDRFSFIHNSKLYGTSEGAVYKTVQSIYNAPDDKPDKKKGILKKPMPIKYVQ